MSEVGDGDSAGPSSALSNSYPYAPTSSDRQCLRCPSLNSPLPSLEPMKAHGQLRSRIDVRGT